MPVVEFLQYGEDDDVNDREFRERAKQKRLLRMCVQQYSASLPECKTLKYIQQSHLQYVLCTQ